MLIAVVLAGVAGCSSFSEQAALSKGSKLYNSGRYEDAVKEYERVLALDHDHWTANYMVAAAHMELYPPGSTLPKDVEHGEQALTALKRCLELQAPDEVTHKKVEDFYAALLTAMERTDDAIEYFEGVLAKQPDDPELLGRIGELYHRKGDFNHALEYFQRRAQATPQSKQAWYVIGVMCWERAHRAGNTISPEQRIAAVDQGLEALNRAIQVDDKYREALVYMNLLWRERSAALVDLRQTVAAGEAMNQAMEFERRAAAIPKEPAGDRAGG